MASKNMEKEVKALIKCMVNTKGDARIQEMKVLLENVAIDRIIRDKMIDLFCNEKLPFNIYICNLTTGNLDYSEPRETYRRLLDQGLEGSNKMKIAFIKLCELLNKNDRFIHKNILSLTSDSVSPKLFKDVKEAEADKLIRAFIKEYGVQDYCKKRTFGCRNIHAYRKEKRSLCTKSDFPRVMISDTDYNGRGSTLYIEIAIPLLEDMVF